MFKKRDKKMKSRKFKKKNKKKYLQFEELNTLDDNLQKSKRRR